MTYNESNMWLWHTRLMLDAVYEHRKAGYEEIGAMRAAIPGERLDELRDYFRTFEGSIEDVEDWARDRVLMLGRWAKFQAFLNCIEDLNETTSLDLMPTYEAFRSFDHIQAEAAWSPDGGVLLQVMKEGTEEALGMSDQWYEDFLAGLAEIKRAGGWERYYMLLRIQDPGPNGYDCKGQA